MFKNSVMMLVAFCFGSMVTYLVMTKQKMDGLLAPPSITNSAQTPHHPSFSTSNQIATSSINDSVGAKHIDEKSSFDLQDDKTSQPQLSDYTEEQAQAMVDDMPDVVLEQYIDKFMAKETSELLTDKRLFAKRAIEELYSQNDNQPLIGNIKLSTSQSTPSQSMDTSTVNKSATLYAHLDTFGQVPTGAQVFVKWVNTTTGQVLLFEQKSILANRNQNWVSMTPYDGWQEGSYDIRFYQFTSELLPIAQLSYQIYEVNE